jgi:hypothetical protein
MRPIVTGAFVLLLAACTTPAPEPSASSISAAVSASPSPLPTVVETEPEMVLVRFRLTLTGTVPDDAAFAVETEQVGEEGAAVYLCAYYAGWPICDVNQGTYEELYRFPPGARVHYRFWRELDPNGAVEEIESGEITVGATDEVVSVGYDIQP